MITDGGYHLWRVCQPPIKCAFTPVEALWSSRLESIRKNVECTFGILKKRFAILKFPMQYSTRDKLDNVFHVCCIFHNMLLEYDGLHDSFHDVVNWSYYENDDDDLFLGLQAARAADRLRLLRNRGPDRSFCARSNITTVTDEPIEVQFSCYELQALLAQSFFENKHLVGWARRK